MADQEPKDYIKPFTLEEVAGKTLQEIVEAMQPNPYTLVGDPLIPNQRTTQRLTDAAASLEARFVKAELERLRREGFAFDAMSVNRARARELYQQRIPMRYDHPQPTLLDIVNPAPMLLDPMTNNDPRFAIELGEVAEVKPGPYDIEVSK